MDVLDISHIKYIEMEKELSESTLQAIKILVEAEKTYQEMNDQTPDVIEIVNNIMTKAKIDPIHSSRVCQFIGQNQ